MYKQDSLAFGRKLLVYLEILEEFILNDLSHPLYSQSPRIAAWERAVSMWGVYGGVALGGVWLHSMKVPDSISKSSGYLVSQNSYLVYILFVLLQ